MSLKTSLDGRSEDNNSLTLKDKSGNTLAIVKLLGTTSTTLEISTMEGLFIEKPSGWKSNKT